MWTATVALCVALAAQQDAPPANPALQWALAQRKRISEAHNHVVGAYGTGRLARMVCAIDREEGSALFRDALRSMDALPSAAFTDRAEAVLPVSSYTGLWKFVGPAALKCDPDLRDLVYTDRAKARMERERRDANATLQRGADLIDPRISTDRLSQMDRAAQLVDAALDAGDPQMMDISLLATVLCWLRERIPDVADDLFLKALELVMSPRAPSPESFQKLGTYLFTSQRYVELPDEEARKESFKAGGTDVQDLSATRHSANPDLIDTYLEASARLLQNVTAAGTNPAASYAIAFQMLGTAREILSVQAEPLEKAATFWEPLAASATQTIHASLGASGAADPDGGDRAERDYRTVSRIRAAMASGHIAEARGLLARIDAVGARSQTGTLVDFAEAAATIEAAHVDEALSLANHLRPGVKRTLLYGGIIARAPNRDVALQTLTLAERDVALLPAEQKMALLSALASAILRWDVAAGMQVMTEAVTAYNDAYTRPRRGKFDPATATRAYNPDTDSSTDTSLILGGPHGFCEAVDMARGRQNFRLKVPGVDAFSMSAFLRGAREVDPARLEATLISLRDENRQINSLLDLADLLLRAAKQ